MKTKLVRTPSFVPRRGTACCRNRASLSCLALILLSPFSVPAQETTDKPFDIVGEGAAPLKQMAGKQVPELVPPRPLAPLEPQGKRIYHGVCINAENASEFPRRVHKYTEIAGHRPSVIVQFAHAYSTEKALDWDYYAPVLRTIDKEGAIPFLKATTQTWANPQLFFKADDILAGKHDAFFIKAARVCKDFGKPMFVSWNHEMNGDWFSYSEARAANRLESDWTAEKFAKVWRHIWTIFQEQGATNVAFAFAPNLVGRKLGPLDELHSWKAYWPGDKYVDWIAPSFYNEVSPEAMDALAAETNKPIFPSEWGMAKAREKWYRGGYPGDAVWMAKMMDYWMHRYPNLKGSGYYHWEKNYMLGRTPEGAKPYADAMNDPMFIHGTPVNAATP